MSESIKLIAIAEDAIVSKIYLVRGKKVMLDRDLAELYGVETRLLNQAVRRNEKSFPADFMFQLTMNELEDWKSQIVISNKERMGLSGTVSGGAF
jgi:ORF6N domain